MIRDVGISTLWKNAKQMGWKISIIIVVPGLFIIFQAIAWWLCIEKTGSKITLKRIMLIQIAGWAFSEVAPFSSIAGETFKGVVLKDKLKGSTIVSSLVLYNTIHTFATISILCVGVVITLIIIKTTAIIKIISIASIIIAIFLFLLFIKEQKKGMLLSLYNFFKKIKFLKKKLSGKEEKIIAIDKEMHHFWVNKKRNYIMAFLFMFCAKIFGALEYYLILIFIGYAQSFLIALFLFIISHVIFIAAFFIPSQIGLVTGGLNRTFKLLDLNPAYGTLVGIFRRIRVLCWTIFGLLLIPFLDARSKQRDK